MRADLHAEALHPSKETPSKSVRRPGIEPGDSPWEGEMLPLHHRRESDMQRIILDLIVNFARNILSHAHTPPLTARRISRFFFVQIGNNATMAKTKRRAFISSP